MKRWLMGCVVLAMVASVQASIYTVSPTVCGRTLAGETGFAGGETIVGLWWSPENTSWLKFDIPVYPEENIVSVKLNLNVISQYNGNFTSDVFVTYVSDDSWTGSTVTSAWPAVESTRVMNRVQTDNGTGNGLVSTDIISYLTQPSEGQGQTLSIRLNRGATGGRGALMDTPTLTITTQAVPEPATMTVLLVSMMAGLWSRKNK